MKKVANSLVVGGAVVTVFVGEDQSNLHHQHFTDSGEDWACLGSAKFLRNMNFEIRVDVEGTGDYTVAMTKKFGAGTDGKGTFHGIPQNKDTRLFIQTGVLDNEAKVDKDKNNLSIMLLHADTFLMYSVVILKTEGHLFLYVGVNYAGSIFKYKNNNIVVPTLRQEHGGNLHLHSILVRMYKERLDTLPSLPENYKLAELDLSKLAENEAVVTISSAPRQFSVAKTREGEDVVIPWSQVTNDITLKVVRPFQVVKFKRIERVQSGNMRQARFVTLPVSWSEGRQRYHQLLVG